MSKATWHSSVHTEKVNLYRQETLPQSVTAGVYLIWWGMWNGVNPDTPAHTKGGLQCHGCLEEGCSVKCPNWLTHCGLITSYGDKDLGQHWLKYLLVNFSLVKLCGLDLRAISQRMPKLLVNVMSLKIALSKLLPYLLGSNELNMLINKKART